MFDDPKEAGPKDDGREELARELGVAARRWRTRLDERFRALGSSESRWAALYWLRRAPQGLSQTALAELAGVESPSLVRTLDLLCEAGLVQRRISPRDRRTKLVALTPAALPLIEQLDRLAAELRQDLMAELADEEIATTLRTLRKLRARLDQPEPAAVSAAGPAPALPRGAAASKSA